MDVTDVVRRHNPSAVWPVPANFRRVYTHAVELPRGARWLLIAGQIGVAPDGRVAEGFPAQCRQAIANVEALLAAASMTRSDLVKVTYYLTRTADLPALSEVRHECWASETPPAVTTLVVAALARPELLVEIEAVAAKPANREQ